MRKSEVRMEQVDIKEVIEDVLKSMQEIIDSKDINIDNQIALKILITGNQQLLVSLFSNIITNAIKFSYRKGKVLITCTNGAYGYKNIIIEDNGTGMDDNTKNKLFRMDARISRSGTGNETGTGLGLIICKDIAESLNGEISIESEQGNGTKVIVKLKGF